MSLPGSEVEDLALPSDGHSEFRYAKVHLGRGDRCLGFLGGVVNTDFWV